jgi:DNA-binding transcriptional MerR regulator
VTKNSAAKTPATPQAFSSLEVATITGVSLRQLQWWDEQGVVTPMQKGHRRLYRMSEVVEIALITELRRKGISLQKIRKVLAHVQKEHGASFYAPRKNGSELHLLTDGDSVFLEDSDRGIVNILKQSNQPIISVCVSDQVAQLNARTGLRKPVTRETHTAQPVRTRKAS